MLHEGTIFPVREKGIPVNIRNTNDPNHPGTIIQEEFEKGELVEDRFITGISGKKDFSIVHLSKRGLSNEVGLLRRILTIYERHNVSVVYVPNGIDSVSVVVETEHIEPVLYTILAEIQQEIQPDTLTVIDELAVVTAVGRHMANTPGISGKLFGALGKAGINIRFITQSPDELNIIFGVENKDFKRAIQVLYDKFAK